jgi:23S rRNA (uracil1939-C5)-methyltransferase
VAEPRTEVELVVESLAHGGDAVARWEGRAVFLPGGAPGDRVAARLLGDRRGAARAELLRVLHPGPARVAPPCPYVAECGGCPWQHVSYEAQLAAKHDTVARALRGVCEPASCTASPRAFGYRRRARFHPAGKGKLGFAGRRSGLVSPIPECLLLEPEVGSLYAAVKDFYAREPEWPGLESLALDTAAAHLRYRVGPPRAARAKAERMLREVRGLRGVVLDGPGAPPLLLGDPVALEPAPAEPGSRLRTRPDLFAQANRAATPALVELALRLAGDPARGRVLELFSGCGTLTHAFAARAREVVAVESEPASLALARASCEEAGRGNVRFIAGDAARTAQGLAHEGHSFDLVVLDPPRAGAKDAMAFIAALAPRRVLYASCDPATLARDARLLAGRGYRCERAVPVDLFPQTFHVEVVAAFARD